MSCDAEGERKVSDQVPGDEDDDEGGGDGQVGGDDTASTAGQGDDRGDGGQLVTNHDGIGGLQREVCSYPAHSDSGVGGGQGRRVIDAVADHEDVLTGLRLVCRPGLRPRRCGRRVRDRPLGL